MLHVFRVSSALIRRPTVKRTRYCELKKYLALRLSTCHQVTRIHSQYGARHQKEVKLCCRRGRRWFCSRPLLTEVVREARSLRNGCTRHTLQTVLVNLSVTPLTLGQAIFLRDEGCRFDGDRFIVIDDDRSRDPTRPPRSSFNKHFRCNIIDGALFVDIRFKVVTIIVRICCCVSARRGKVLWKYAWKTQYCL